MACAPKCTACNALLKNAGGVANNIENVARLRKLEATTEQGSLMWLDSRQRVMTASEFHDIVGSKTNTSAMRKKLKITTFKGNKYTEHGHKYEPVACAKYERDTGHVVAHFGLWVNRDLPHFESAPVGGSSDGVTLCGRLIEIKCPYTRAITGVVPRSYLTQMQLLMLVGGLEVCDFVEFKPPELVGGDGEFLITQVARDPEWWGGDVLQRARDFWKVYSDVRGDDGKTRAFATTSNPRRCQFNTSHESVCRERGYIS